MSVGGESETPGGVLLRPGVGEDEGGDGGQREEDHGHKEQRGPGRRDVSPAQTDLSL